ncbi:TetR/AcrR family transcriptional regulator [Bacillus manliponensis]|uniref:TetR/AcrR family transcriptional regulator n=1 Tax=Bacillus manliponensis TaxID=574376 RepID=UPI0035141B3E
MKEKERLVIETGMKLFAKKGVTATSVQEIASESGISKGAFYLYFKSKESLLLSIMQYYYDKIQHEVMGIENESLPPREKFEKQLYCQFEELQKHKEFIIMCARENAIPFNKEVEELMRRMKIELHEFYRNGLLSIYGEKAKHHLLDSVIMLESITRGYIELTFLSGINLDLAYVAKFILKRMDDIVDGLSRSKEQPIINEAKLGLFLCYQESTNEQIKESFLHEITVLKQELADQLESDELLVTLEVLEVEMRKNSPRVPVIQGMLANVNLYPELKDFHRRIAEYFSIKMI